MDGGDEPWDIPLIILIGNVKHRNERGVVTCPLVKLNSTFNGDLLVRSIDSVYMEVGCRV